MKNRILVWSSLLVLTSQACVEYYVPDIKDDVSIPLIVVMGKITDETGSFKVKLSIPEYLFEYQNNIDIDNPLTGANVWISDDHNNSWYLRDKGNGWYETSENDLQGIPGNTYYLTINTPFGKNYSASSQMLTSPGIENLYYDKYSYTDFTGLEPIDKTGLNILIDCEAAEQNNYFFWEYEETWEFDMPAYVSVDHGICLSPDCIPATMENIIIDTEKAHCWVSEPSTDIIIESPISYKNNEVRSFIVKSIPVNSDRLNIKYSILVKQYALNYDMYRFFRQLRETNVETEGLYAKMPGKVAGNISCEDGETALGYFFASSVSEKRIFIEYFDHQVGKGSSYNDCGWTDFITPYQVFYLYGYTDAGTAVYSSDRYCTDCRVRGTNVMPDFWK